MIVRGTERYLGAFLFAMVLQGGDPESSIAGRSVSGALRGLWCGGRSIQVLIDIGGCARPDDD
jgi:hypothetical protein